MKSPTVQEFVTHVALVFLCVMTFIVVVLAWFPDLVQNVFLLNLFIGMHRLRDKFKSYKVNLTIQCQSFVAAAKFCVLSSVWWVSEPLIGRQDIASDD